jgi:hypothetical protein
MAVREHRINLSAAPLADTRREPCDSPPTFCEDFSIGVCYLLAAIACIIVGAFSVFLITWLIVRKIG